MSLPARRSSVGRSSSILAFPRQPRVVSSPAVTSSLLDQVLANLDDDAPRLVYADALQAKGDPRGELIALQCELARLGRATRSPNWDWIGDALLDPDAIDEAQVRKLRRRETAISEGARRRLDGRRAEPSAVGAAGAKALAASAKAGSLRVLSLLGNGVGPDGARALARSEHLAGLRALDLWKNKLGVEGARALGAAFRELRTLDLTANPLGEPGVAALAGGDGLGELRELCLQQTGVDDAAVVALARSPLLERVRVVNLRSNKNRRRRLLRSPRRRPHATSSR